MRRLCPASRAGTRRRSSGRRRCSASCRSSGRWWSASLLSFGRRGAVALPPRLVVRGPGPLQLEKLFGRGGQYVVAAGSDHRQVLDPDAAEAGKVDTRLHGHGRPWRDPTIGTHPHSGGLVAPTRTLGASWISRPMPWPEGWLKASPRPARPITSRQARSTAAPLTPARRAARPAAWARRTTS